jgi:hypothetical protein
VPGLDLLRQDMNDLCVDWWGLMTLQLSKFCKHQYLNFTVRPVLYCIALHLFDYEVNGACACAHKGIVEYTSSLKTVTQR